MYTKILNHQPLEARHPDLLVSGTCPVVNSGLDFRSLILHFDFNFGTYIEKVILVEGGGGISL